MSKLLMPILEGCENGSFEIREVNGWDIILDANATRGLTTVFQNFDTNTELVVMVCALCEGDQVTAMLGEPLEGGPPLMGTAYLSSGEDDSRDTVEKQLTFAVKEALQMLQKHYDEKYINV